MSLKRSKNTHVKDHRSGNEISGKYTHLSKRIIDLGTGLIPLINNSEKCYCERSCSDLCLNRLNHQECNKNICGLSDHLHDVYCNNKPFLRFYSQKKHKYAVERFRNKYEKETEILNKKNPFQTSTKLVLLNKVVKGELIIECCGEILTNNDLRDRYCEYFSLNKTCNFNEKNYENKNIPERVFCLVEDFIYLDMTKIGNEGRHIRHSCKPNSQAEIWISKPSTCSSRSGIGNEYTLSWIKMGVFALEDLDKGVEVTIDYENLMSRCIPIKGKKHDNSVRYFGMFECNCNSNNCRKIIGTTKFPKECELSEYLIPTPNKKKRRSNNEAELHIKDNETENRSFNKNSFDTFIFLREKIIEDQRNWKDTLKKKDIKKPFQNTLTIFEHDINKIFEIERSILNNHEIEKKLPDHFKNLPLWYIFSSICWQGFPNYQECCNNILPHNYWWKFNTSETKKRVIYNSPVNFKPVIRPKRSCSIKKQHTPITKLYGQNLYDSSANSEKKIVFFHLMTHPWLLTLYNLTNIDIEYSRVWRSFLARSIELGRWFVVQRLSIFFKINQISDEELAWPLIDRGLGDDEKCIVCFFHGTLFSCDICSKSIHKSCLKKCNKFIESQSFCLPNWFSSRNILKESYFREIISNLFSNNTGISTLSNLQKNKIKLTVIYNPSKETTNDKTELKNQEKNDSNSFACHRCSNSLHVKFWLELKGSEKRIVTKNAMKMRFFRAYKSHFYNKSAIIKERIKEQNQLNLKLSKRKLVDKRPQKNNDIRSAKMLISNLFIWRQSKSKINGEIRNIIGELLKNFQKKKQTDPRWDIINNNPSPSSLKYNPVPNLAENKIQTPISEKSFDLSISKQECCQIINSVSIEEFVKSFKN